MQPSPTQLHYFGLFWRCAKAKQPSSTRCISLGITFSAVQSKAAKSHSAAILWAFLSALCKRKAAEFHSAAFLWAFLSALCKSNAANSDLLHFCHNLYGCDMAASGQRADLDGGSECTTSSCP
eukprot:1157834-Pelagomonas_calceolata.AAC.3